MANDFQSRLKTWQQEGWEIQKAKGGHLKLLHKDAKVPVFCASTPSDYRAVLNIESELKRALGVQRTKPFNEEKAKVPVKPKAVNPKTKRFVIWYEDVVPVKEDSKTTTSLFSKIDAKIRIKVWQLIYLRLRMDYRELSTIHAIKRRMKTDDEYFRTVLKSFKSSGDEIRQIRTMLIERTRNRLREEKYKREELLRKLEPAKPEVRHFRRRRRGGLSKNGIRCYS